MAYADLLVGPDVPALFLGGGIAAGALVGWVMGPGRGPVLLARSVSRVAVVVLVVILASAFVPLGFLAFAARASLAAALGFLCGGLTQMLATAWSAGGVHEGGGQGRALVLVSLLCLSLWAFVLALFAVPLLVFG